MVRHTSIEWRCRTALGPIKHQASVRKQERIGYTKHQHSAPRLPRLRACCQSALQQNTDKHRQNTVLLACRAWELAVSQRSNKIQTSTDKTQCSSLAAPENLLSVSAPTKYRQALTKHSAPRLPRLRACCQSALQQNTDKHRQNTVLLACRAWELAVSQRSNRIQINTRTTGN